jgi:hypothetical protein
LDNFFKAIITGVTSLSVDPHMLVRKLPILYTLINPIAMREIDIHIILALLVEIADLPGWW